jgi:hypothetical protein
VLPAGVADTTGRCCPGRKGRRNHRQAAFPEHDPLIPDTVEGEPVVDVEPATEPLTPEEIREAQERDQGESEGEPESDA